MSPFSLVLTAPFRASGSSGHLRDKSSHHIDDSIYRYYPNISIDSLQLRKERHDPKHEFVFIGLQTGGRCYHYRIERRPLKEASLNSKMQGCTAEDTITRVTNDEVWNIRRSTDRKIDVQFESHPKPDLYTIFAFCHAIRKDPGTEKYTLAEFNCFFLARNLTLLLIRHFLLCQYSIRISPRADFNDLPESEINPLVAKVMEINASFTIDHWFIWITLTPQDFENRVFRTYEEVRMCILEMNKEHDTIAAKWLGRDEDEVYHSYDRKKEDIWRYIVKANPL